jgi:hypothetical protein
MDFSTESNISRGGVPFRDPSSVAIEIAAHSPKNARDIERQEDFLNRPPYSESVQNVIVDNPQHPTRIITQRPELLTRRVNRQPPVES